VHYRTHGCEPALHCALAPNSTRWPRRLAGLRGREPDFNIDQSHSITGSC
jgi:hypothetical protein